METWERIDARVECEDKNCPQLWERDFELVLNRSDD